MMHTKTRIAKGIFCLLLILLLVVSQSAAVAEAHFDYCCATKEEGAELLMGNTAYYAGFSQNELEYKLHKIGATMEELMAIVPAQMQDFTQEDRHALDTCMASIEETIRANGYVLPALDQVIFVKTTQLEEGGGSAAYTHGTQIYVSDKLLKRLVDGDGKAAAQGRFIMWHELFHCLTRCSPDFRADMYQLIHFTVRDEDYPLPASVMEYYISNPDVEHHNAYATFLIGGEPVDCFTAWITTRRMEAPEDQFFAFTATALVPVDGRDTFYLLADAANANDIFGKNTSYVTDPEECMADNFGYAMTYGIDGMEYGSPEIIQGILDYVSAARQEAHP